MKETISDKRHCPVCKVDWRGKKIPKEYKEHYPSGATHYSRLIGIEIQGGYDGVSYWECPDCKTRWDRWTHKQVK
ncbi:hypothetical protein A2Z67_04930 [Candidatus Woesebacteria bacterium RBG_13_36_22]|uniref:Uncharacterized protein n=1 Tax=Candidatus Woesebacteria bacterium RBG_13_36_22 TaxID=1802478 RepID=A0A1F7X4N0_9BACT|nr:MAG: hypothetical protein A2Z67_04930 [Candidatus Woesebacteria bacterium RBG_13_36_22]